ncbi:MAG: malto-oligosyltrehalose synthase, partial [Propionicimonas sp.]
RLQLHAGFTFADAAARLDYLERLGVTDLYLSPILASVPGSAHGYDVVDPTRVSDERGGREGFESLATAAHARGMGVVVDIVPNHMAIPDPLWLNPPLWSALREGPESPYAEWFDIEAGAALVLPIVQLDGEDDPVPALVAGGRLAFGDLDRPDRQREPVLTLDGSPFPLAPGTTGLPLAEAVAAQRYSLQRWQGNHTRLTHRRFFDIVTLIGVRQENHAVFEATHALLLELFRAGHIDGFRVDHPDGLADPQGYFEQLRDATGGAWVVAEKILTGDELLPAAWPVAGTTGYEASWRFDAVQLDPAAAPALAELAQRTDSETDPEPTTWPVVATTAERFVADTSLAIDVDRLIRLAARVDPGRDEADLRACLREFLVALDRYRAYVRPGTEPDAGNSRVLDDAAARAASGLPRHLHPTLAWLHELAAGRGLPAEPLPGARDAAREFVVRFQQVSGALVAKGVEDTAFYRWTQLLALCDVGADPASFGLAPSELHTWLRRVNAGWPATMALASTHDSKRSEDVRARIAAISEFPDEWTRLVDGLAPTVGHLPGPIRTILWQSLAGTWTPDGPIPADRLAGFLVKAGREQKLWTSWVSPDDRLEEVVAGAAAQVLADPAVRAAFDAWTVLVADAVETSTLSARLVQLTALGVADTYQGQETVRLSLTDPDNRRPVDYDSLADELDRLDGPAASGLAARKLLVTSTALQLRRRHPDAFVGPAAGYRPLDSTTSFGWGFARGGEPVAATIATRLAGRRPAWRPADVVGLPPGDWRNLLTGAVHAGEFGLGSGLGGWPCALLERFG